MDAKHKQIIGLLNRKTAAGHAKWRETSVKQQFSTQLESGTILIEPTFDKTDNVRVFVLSILNNSGDRIESLTVSPLKQKSEFNLVSRLYDAIKQKYYKVDETLDSIIDELKRGQSVGNEDED